MLRTEYGDDTTQFERTDLPSYPLCLEKEHGHNSSEDAGGEV